MTINIINLLLSILSEIWSRNRLIAFLISITISFPRWRPIWPPNHNNGHISTNRHDRETNFVSIALNSWAMNTMVTLSILTILYFSRWWPIWPPNRNDSNISTHKHNRETNLVSITMYSWAKNSLLVLQKRR